MAISLLPAFRESDALAYNFSLHDRRNDLARYMDISLPPGKYISDYSNHKTFNRSWGGYNGTHEFHRYEKQHVMLNDRPVREWREQGIDYAIMPHAPMLKDPDAFYPDETVLLKTYPPDPNFRGPSMVVLRLYPMQYRAAGQLGGIHLLGYDINTTQLQAGEELVFRHYWQAEAPTTSPQHVFNHLLDAEGNIVTQADYVPLFDDRRPTTTWDDPEEILLGREFSLALPPGLPAGEYQLVSGLYNPVTWQRLISPDGSDRVHIAAIEVDRP